jgi:hypothetical protein
MMSMVCDIFAELSIFGYLRVGGAGNAILQTWFEPRKLPENTQTSVSQLHAVLGSNLLILPIAEFYVFLRIAS